MALLEQLRDEFISRLDWSDKATEDQKQLVNGNIRSFTQFLAGRLGNAVAARSAPEAAAPVAPQTEKAGEHGYKEYTSPEVASLAARGIRDPGSLTPEEIKRVCASALTQAGGDPTPPKPQG